MRNKKKLKNLVKGLVLLVVCTNLVIVPDNVVATEIKTEETSEFTISKKIKSFTIKPNDKPYKNKYTNYSTYNKYTKQYYLMRSYLEELERLGGGELILTKGTYTITNMLCVPSNVTITFKDGVVIKKGIKTGTTKLTPAKSIFQLVAPSKFSKKGAYGKYDGEKNIKFIGEGNVTIDLNYFEDSIAIIAGHNQNILIENIVFKNMKSGHFLEIDATKNATVKDNKFINSKPSKNQNKEAINLDTPDRNTGGWSQEWSKFDKTPNKNIYIENNKFSNLDRAIGTHKYSDKKYHENIVLKGNIIDKTRKDAIRIMNWKDCVIENNKVSNVRESKESYRGILASGAINPTIKNNTFENMVRPMQFMPTKNEAPGSQYPVTYNKLSKTNKKDLINNKLKKVTEQYIRINNKYNVFDDYTEKFYFQNRKNNFKLSANSKPFENNYVTSSNYNKNTKQYFMLRSYLEQLERTNGGTIELEKGVYKITNTLYIPSNVTIKLNDGVIIEKSNITGVKEMKPSKALFQLTAPSKSNKRNVYSKYSGEENIKILGTGVATIDLKNINESVAFVLGHNKNIIIDNLNFKNMYDGNFIRIASAYNVKITESKFMNSKPSKSKSRDAISLVVPDKTLKNWPYEWSKQDKTPNKKICIENNQFKNLDRAIGSSTYSEKIYHENIEIRNNSIDSTRTDAIRVTNWKNSTLEKNSIKNVNSGKAGTRGILISGGINISVKNNKLENVSRPIQFMPYRGDNKYKVTYNKLSKSNLKDLKTNKIRKVQEEFIRINHKYNIFDKYTDKIKLSTF